MSGNPTLDAANEATGSAPLNSGPTEPQVPNEQPTGDEIPASLSSLPSGVEAVVLPLDTGSGTKNNQSVSSLPKANEFEDLLKAKIRPEGPSRAEEVDVQSLGSKYTDLVEKVKNAVEGGQVKVYKVETGVGKGEYYVAGLDIDGERIVAVRVQGLDG